MTAWLFIACFAAGHWEHPGGIVTVNTISEVESKLEGQAWVRERVDVRKAALKPWLDAECARRHRGRPLAVTLSSDAQHRL
ncbi:MAG TPA: hypothetical protein ENN80_05500 [Candidatus Hydrogenedentes bacterium]|nr:hypothetical protein [Candidatus Hydrogenedentota bacterium]